jgi:hypothetical protein
MHLAKKLKNHIKDCINKGKHHNLSRILKSPSSMEKSIPKE